MPGGKVNEDFLQSVADVLERTRKNAKAAIGLSMVYAYFETGRLIVEEEQNGSQRVVYGKYLIPELLKYLTERMGQGYSVTNLKLIRIDNVNERHFYEIEAAQNHWALKNWTVQQCVI